MKLINCVISLLGIGIGCSNQHSDGVVKTPEPIVEAEKLYEVDGVTLWKIRNPKYISEYGSNEYIFFTTGECGRIIDADR